MKWALCFFQSHDNGKTFTNFHSRYFLSKEAIDAELPILLST
jgi:hypothetical protein